MIARPNWRGHLAIARIDHWFKNVFVIPGIVVAFGTDPFVDSHSLWRRVLVGFTSICLVASSNYTINEVLDADDDRHHPTKHARPVPSGLVNIRLAYLQWILLMLVGVGLGSSISTQFAVTVAMLWLMGCVYNIPPARTKDIPYVDVVSEAVNNPLRMLAGWYIVTRTVVAPASLLLSYWMVGCYFMALKRFAEFRHIGDASRAAAYRKSFAFYTTDRLLVSVMFYASASMLFFGAFVMRYRLELILAFPAIAFVMAVYLSLSFNDDSAVQKPEKLYREPTLMLSVVGCALLIAGLLFVDLPLARRLFVPTVPTQPIPASPSLKNAVP